MKSRIIDKKTTKQVRIDAGLHRLLKAKAAKSGMTIKSLFQGYVEDLLAVENENES